MAPAAGPTVAQAAAANLTIDTIANSGATRTTNVATIKTTAAHGLAAGQSVDVTVTSDATFNGTNQVVIAVPTATTFTYANVGIDVAGGLAGGGTVVPYTVGNVGSGVHQIAFFFITRSGHWTKFSPPTSFTAGSGVQLALTNVLTGPPNVVGRGICMTLSGGARYYHVASSMLLNDNATTTFTLNVKDTTLGAGAEVTYLKNLEVLGYAARPIDYAGRLFWLGEESVQSGFNNLGFEGGRAATGRPAGWTDGAAPAGGSVIDVSATDFGWAYRITGDGATAFRGTIFQDATKDAWTQTPQLQTNTLYTIKARIRTTGAPVAGQIEIILFSGGTGYTGGIVLTVAQLSGTWTEYSAAVPVTPKPLPVDLSLYVQASGTLSNGATIDVDNVRLTLTQEPVRRGFARASRSDDPEAYDGTTGFLLVEENDGQKMPTGFRLRNFLYFVKERSLHVTNDDGISEPASWTIDTVSATVGTPSIHGHASGEGWEVIANRASLYLFYGGTAFYPLTNEIQPIWDRINWEGAGSKVWVTVNTKKRRILVGVPLDNALQPNMVLMLYYGSTPGPFGSLMIDPLTDPEKGRKWAPWTLTVNSAGLIENPSGAIEYFGSGGGDGAVMKLDVNTFQDYSGAAVDSWYSTAYLGGSGFGRKLFGYIVSFIQGVGTLLLSARRQGGVTTVNLRNHRLPNPCTQDMELPINLLDNRLSFRIRTNAVGSWWEVTKFVPYVKQDPFAPIGGNK
jgi:hypothetical protein